MQSLNPSQRAILIVGYDAVNIERSERKDSSATYLDADTPPIQADDLMGNVKVLRLSPDWEPDETRTDTEITVKVPQGDRGMLFWVRDFTTLIKDADVAATVIPVCGYGTELRVVADDDEDIQEKLRQEMRARAAAAELDYP